MDLEFTADWATSHFKLWAEVLAPLRGRPCTGLELGCYEGRSAIWFLQHVVTHPDARLVCIDGWWNENVYRRFLRNVVAANVVARCDVHRGSTHAQLRTLRQPFDFIYIDADHRAAAVLADAVLSWHLLPPDGVLIFDDYLWTDPDGADAPPPKVGIDGFLAAYEGRYELLHKDWQVILRKL